MIGLELIGDRRATATLTGIALRSLALEPAWEAAFRLQERAQHAPFAAGRLTDTGTLQASLTQPNALGAIREVHGGESEFGTSIPYARPAAHQAGTHVLVEPPSEAIAELTIRYILTGGKL